MYKRHILHFSLSPKYDTKVTHTHTHRNGQGHDIGETEVFLNIGFPANAVNVNHLLIDQAYCYNNNYIYGLRQHDVMQQQ